MGWIKKKISKFNFTNPSKIGNIRNPLLEQWRGWEGNTLVWDEGIVAQATRTLRARWTPELAQDIAAYHGIDAEAELTALLSEHIYQEIAGNTIGELRHPVTHNLLPNAINIHTRTLGVDLVSVQPLPAPELPIDFFPWFHMGYQSYDQEDYDFDIDFISPKISKIDLFN